MEKHPLRQVIRYRFDSFMARGGSSIFISLVIVFISLLLLIGIVRSIILVSFPGEIPQVGTSSIISNLYIIFLQMTDPGNMNQDIASAPVYKFTAIIAGLVGVIMLSSLIAFTTTTLNSKINELKKGHSKVIEEGQTLILGWNDQRILEILRELILANESENNPCVVILSHRDKEYMDDYLKLRMPNTQNTRIVTRSGQISSLVNLKIASVKSCKSVIVLADCNDDATDDEKAASDARVIKTVLAVTASRPDDKSYGIVAEVFGHHARNVVQNISPDQVTVVDSRDILAKILVQTSRSVGLSVVYSEVLSFDGCEMYFYGADWDNIEFGKIPYCFKDGVPMGIKKESGELKVNPDKSTKMEPKDEVLVLAEDDSTIDFSKSPIIQPKEFNFADGKLKQKIERELLLGWTPKAPIILEQYSDYVLPGSTIDIMLHKPTDAVRNEIKRLQEKLTDLKISLIESDPLQADVLVSAKPFHYDNIIILTQSTKFHDAERIDSETITILLMLREIFKEHPEEAKSTKLITEVMNSENQELVACTGVNDFIISDRFVSMLFAQISEGQDIKRVYDDLFEEDGSEIYLKPASLYFTDLPQTVTFADLLHIAQKRDEICLGLKLKKFETESDKNYGVKLNPYKGATFEISIEDSLVVLAEDET